MNSDHIIETARLRLEPTTPAHAELVYAALDDDAMWKFFPAYRPQSLEALRERYQRFAGGYPDSDRKEFWENWTAFLRQGEEPVGSMQATIAVTERTAHIAYGIHRAHWQKGYAAEAARAVLRHLMIQHNVQTAFAEMNTANHASVALVESLGFRRVELRKDIDSGNGLIGDEYLYELSLFSVSTH